MFILKDSHADSGVAKDVAHPACHAHPVVLFSIYAIFINAGTINQGKFLVLTL